MPKPKVVHLIPYDGIGGVEEAARSLGNRDFGFAAFELHYLFPKVSSTEQRSATFNPFAMLSALGRLYRLKPDIVVLSLWRAVAVGLLLKLLRPRTKLVLFLHNSKDAHRLDRFVTRLAARVAHEIWADSQATLRKRLAGTPAVPTRVISFVTRKIAPDDAPTTDKQPAPDFVYWGRFAHQKNLPRALDVFQDIKTMFPKATLTLIGATAPDMLDMTAELKRRGLEGAVTCHEQMSFDRIRALASDASFYLQTSRYEGMAMSVVEAMQLGLVPVVTPVGEIANYCVDGETALFLPVEPGEKTDVLDRLSRLINGDKTLWQRMSEAAKAKWQGSTTYAEDVQEALRALVSTSHS